MAHLSIEPCPNLLAVELQPSGFGNNTWRNAPAAYRLNSATFGSAINTPYIRKSNTERIHFVACSIQSSLAFSPRQEAAGTLPQVPPLNV
jgi:hypothetical protein